MKKNQLMIVAGATVIVLLLGIGGAIFALRGSGQPAASATPEPKKKRLDIPVNVIAVNERPYAYITPVADGRNIEITVAEVKKAADSAEFLLEYQAGETLQAFGDMLDISSLPVTTKKLLGSCSAGGSCTYHENIQGGLLDLTFEGSETYKLVQRWKYYDNWGNSDTEFASDDKLFTIKSANLGKQRFVIVYNSPGYPEGLTGEPASELYSVTASGAVTGEAIVSIKTDVSDGVMMAFDGSQWQALETSFADGTATATGDIAELYVVVSE